MVSKIRWEQVNDAHKMETPPAIAPRQKVKKKLSWKYMGISLFVLLLAGVGFVAYQQMYQKKAEAHYFPSYITKDQFDIPVYYPKDLPVGYTVSNYKIIKKNILTYSVTNSKNQVFNVTLQTLTTSFDFVKFKKKFVKPDEYNTPIGSNLVGVAGSNLVGSIQTTDSVWILLNSKSTDSIKDMETITRSLRKVELPN
jgi:hypothetical protein